MTGRLLVDLVHIRGRFHRSVALSRDWDAGADLSEYLVTPTARQLSERIVSELLRQDGTRAWTITGPYGSGKSAFALFLADLLCRRKPLHAVGQTIRKDCGLGQKHCLPVLLTARRGALAPALLTNIVSAFAGVDEAVAKRARRMVKTGSIEGEELAEFLVDAAARARANHRGGLVVILDELGKFLEHAADRSTDEDVYVLQQLAEAAARSDAPILLLGILHTGFADYLPVGDEFRRTEWQKVQGRFHDVPFQLPAEQMLALVGHAIRSEDVPVATRKRWDQVTNRVARSDALREAAKRVPLKDLTSRCYPIHPLAALLLWPLFRSKVAQNERSLFAFLTSHEPAGFQEFLKSNHLVNGSVPLFRVSDLYDYVKQALGIAAFSGADSRRWALIDHALNRLPSDGTTELSQLVKTIGLMGLYGKMLGLHPTAEALELAIGDMDDVGEALSDLQKRSIIVYRRHTAAYSLWEGSDLDLDAAFAEAQPHVGQGPLAERVGRLLELRPVVARAHYIESGTLRLMDVQVISPDGNELEQTLARPAVGDGRVVFIVGDDSSAVRPQDIAARVELVRDGQLVVVGVPETVAGLADSLRDYETWDWLSKNLLELHGDPVAQQEVQARLLGARDRFEDAAGGLLGLSGHAFTPQRSSWLYRGEARRINSPREFQRWISDCCDVHYSAAPPLHNELLNRNHLSSAASAARRTLLEHMIVHEQQERLGIEGTPPEASMYESMLRLGGFHRVRQGVLGLGPPKGEWKDTWKAVMDFVKAANHERQPLTALFETLRRAPFGIKEGPLPILVVAALLAKRDEIALYEDGVFVPEIRIEVIERLVRNPRSFELQSQRLDARQRRILNALRSKVATDSAGSDGNALLPIVKALVLAVAKLNPYSRQTRRLDPPEAVEVRNLLLTAADPKKLLFVDLPAALGRSVATEKDVQGFADRLHDSVLALTGAYSRLLDEIEEQIRQVFGLRGTTVEVRNQLRVRSAPLVEFAVDSRLQLFVQEVARDQLRADWREAVGRIVNGGLPLSHWTDRDVTAFQLKLQEFESEFRRLEELVTEKQRSGATRVLRIGYLDGTHSEAAAVIPIDSASESRIGELSEQVRSALGNGHTLTSYERNVRLAALAQVAASLLEHERTTDDD